MHVTGRDLDPGPCGGLHDQGAGRGQVDGGALHRGGADTGRLGLADGDQALPVGGQHRTRPARLGIAARVRRAQAAARCPVDRGAGDQAAGRRPATSGGKSPRLGDVDPRPAARPPAGPLPGGPRPAARPLAATQLQVVGPLQPGRAGSGRPRRPPRPGRPRRRPPSARPTPGDRGPQHHRDQQRAARRGRTGRSRAAPALGLLLGHHRGPKARAAASSAALAIVVGTFATTSGG